MALDLHHSTFYHFPKTGGKFIRHICREQGLVTRELGRTHWSPLMVPPPKGKLSFTFVRHPLSWLRSFWQFSQSVNWGWHPGFQELIECRHDTLEGFTRNLLSQHPGVITGKFKEFYENCAEVGRLENLRADLITVLSSAGEDFDREFILNAEPVNTLKSSEVLPRSLAESVMEEESEVCERFGYTSIPDWVEK